VLSLSQLEREFDTPLRHATALQRLLALSAPWWWDPTTVSKSQSPTMMTRQRTAQLLSALHAELLCADLANDASPVRLDTATRDESLLELLSNSSASHGKFDFEIDFDWGQNGDDVERRNSATSIDSDSLFQTCDDVHHNRSSACLPWAEWMLRVWRATFEPYLAVLQASQTQMSSSRPQRNLPRGTPRLTFILAL
jgi:hypothetical protein